MRRGGGGGGDNDDGETAPVILHMPRTTNGLPKKERGLEDDDTRMDGRTRTDALAGAAHK